MIEQIEQDVLSLDDELKAITSDTCFGKLPNCTCRLIFEQLIGDNDVRDD